MSRTLAQTENSTEFMEDMVRFYKDFGVGKLGTSQSLPDRA